MRLRKHGRGHDFVLLESRRDRVLGLSFSLGLNGRWMGDVGKYLGICLLYQFSRRRRDSIVGICSDCWQIKWSRG